jgi:hypothetical protein
MHTDGMRVWALRGMPIVEQSTQHASVTHLQKYLSSALLPLTQLFLSTAKVIVSSVQHLADLAIRLLQTVVKRFQLFQLSETFKLKIRWWSRWPFRWSGVCEPSAEINVFEVGIGAVSIWRKEVITVFVKPILRPSYSRLIDQTSYSLSNLFRCHSFNFIDGDSDTHGARAIGHRLPFSSVREFVHSYIHVGCPQGVARSIATSRCCNLWKSWRWSPLGQQVEHQTAGGHNLTRNRIKLRVPRSLAFWDRGSRSIGARIAHRLVQLAGGPRMA